MSGKSFNSTVVRALQGAAFLVVAGPLCGVTTSTQERTDSPYVVLALDCSGSMARNFAQSLGMAENLVAALPLESRLSLVRFDEQAVELGRTMYLTAQERAIILQRLRSQKPTGRWTDFGCAVEQVKTAAGQVGEPTLVVIVSDAISDPPVAVAFEDQVRLPPGSTRNRRWRFYLSTTARRKRFLPACQNDLKRRLCLRTRRSSFRKHRPKFRHRFP